MMNEDFGGLYIEAARDFRKARRQADLERIVGRLTGRATDLLAYEEVRKQLKSTPRGRRQLKEIPLDAIVGSVGRYTDFTRSFLPKRSIEQSRWTGVKVAVSGLVGLPSIEVYQIGEVFFVLDGNHRVSVARQLGATHIEAYVIEFHSKVPLSPDDQPDHLILKGEYAEFLEHTRLDKLRPEARLDVTIPGQYCILEEHIQVHRYFMGLDEKRDISYAEAVTHWYDEVYMPVVQVIRERAVLRDFPGRTETDLYLWASDHRGAVMQELGWEIDPEMAAADLPAQVSPKLSRVVARVGERILGTVTPDELEAGPAPGEWRKERLVVRRDESLFSEILVPISGEEPSWRALEQALEIARREGSQLRGLHVVASEARRESEKAQAVQAEFNRRCEEAAVPGKLVLAVGRVPRQVCQRSRWTDLVVLHLAYPPPPQKLARLGSGFRTVIRRCAGPVLAVPGTASALSRALLAYDGTPKADEALYVATYLAGHWHIPLSVVTVMEGNRVGSKTLAHAREYLETHGVQAQSVQENGTAAEAILKTAKSQHSDLIIMGGYGHRPLVEVMLGSVVDEVLRTCRQPVLICR